MSANRRTRRVLDAVKRKYQEATGVEPRDYTLADGTVLANVQMVPFDAYGETWHIPHPLFTPEPLKDAIDDAEKDSQKARVLLGDDQYDLFLASDPHAEAGDVMLMYLDVTQSMQDDLKNAKQDPTRS